MEGSVRFFCKKDFNKCMNLNWNFQRVGGVWERYGHFPKLHNLITAQWNLDFSNSWFLERPDILNQKSVPSVEHYNFILTSWTNGFRPVFVFLGDSKNWDSIVLEVHDTAHEGYIFTFWYNNSLKKPLNLKWLANSSYITDISTAEMVMAMLMVQFIYRKI